MTDYLEYLREETTVDIEEIENDTSSTNLVIIHSSGFDIGMVGEEGYERKLQVYEEEVDEFIDALIYMSDYEEGES